MKFPFQYIPNSSVRELSMSNISKRDVLSQNISYINIFSLSVLLFFGSLALKHVSQCAH